MPAFSFGFIVGMVVGAVLAVSSQVVYNWVKKQRDAAAAKLAGK